MIDVFKGAYDEYNWLKPDVRPGLGPLSQDTAPGRHLPYVTTEERRAWEASEAEITQKIAAIRKTLDTKEPTWKSAGEAERKQLKARIKSLEAERQPEPRIQALWDRGEPSPTYLYRRGDPLTPGTLVGPGVPSALTDGKTPFDARPPWPGSTKTGRRLAFARWLTQPDHPLTARVAVNSIWRHHFGSGIVKTSGNFGKTGSPPTHPQLLDWLARELVDRGWSVKAIHRLIVTSATYRQGSVVTPERRHADPDNALCSRMPLTRLDAEALYDAILAVSGRLEATIGGPGDAVKVRQDGLVTPVRSGGGWRRLLYVKQFRKQIPTHLENFDYPQMNPNCVERRDSTVAPQALYLMNNELIDELAASFAERVSREVGANPGARVDRVYTIALGRTPSNEERQAGLDALKSLAASWENDPDGRKALTTYCHAIVNSAAFLYVD